MKSTLATGFVIGLLLATSTAFAAKTHYKASIEGGAAGSPGTGVGNFTFDDVTKRLCGKATYQGLTGGPVTAVALKEGDGFTIVKELTASASPLSIDVTLGDAAVGLLTTGPIYIAIGNATRGVAAGELQNGEVNGELVVDPAGVEQPCGGSSGDAGPPPAPTPDAASPAPSEGGEGSDASVVSPAPTLPAGQPVTAPATDDGGCSTTSSSTSGAAFFGALGALAVSKRRHRRRR